MKVPRPRPDTATEQKFLIQEFGHLIFLFTNFASVYCVMSWDSVVVIATKLRDGLSAKARRQETFLFSKASVPSLWPIQALDQCVLMTLTPRVKQSGREAGC